MSGANKPGYGMAGDLLEGFLGMVDETISKKMTDIELRSQYRMQKRIDDIVGKVLRKFAGEVRSQLTKFEEELKSQAQTYEGKLHSTTEGFDRRLKEYEGKLHSLPIGFTRRLATLTDCVTAVAGRSERAAKKAVDMLQVELEESVEDVTKSAGDIAETKADKLREDVITWLEDFSAEQKEEIKHILESEYSIRKKGEPLMIPATVPEEKGFFVATGLGTVIPNSLEDAKLEVALERAPEEIPAEEDKSKESKD